MEGVDVVRKGREVGWRPHPGRTAAAALILLVLAYLAVRLAPVYFLSLEFQRRLESLAADPASLRSPDERIRVAVVNQAAHLGLPVKSEHIRLRRSDKGMRVEVRYTVPVDLTLYTVDLHFTPKAGAL
jgi:hypothetical protein